MTRLTVHDLHVLRGGTSVIAGLSLDLAGPGWIGIVGANGSGKTSLLHAFAGRLPADGGRILIDGVDCAIDRAARARRIGFAPDAAMLPDALTPAELIALALVGDDSHPPDALAGLRDALGIDRFIDRRLGLLSAGTRQRVAIYLAFVNRPAIVILDEPFNWLDPLTAYDSKAALSVMVEEGLLLVTALHDLSTLTVYCTTGLLLAGGTVALAMDEAELRQGARNPKAFEHAMVGHLRPNPRSCL